MSLDTKASVISECWIYAGATDRNGYPQYSSKGKTYMIHRSIYEHEVGEIPLGVTLDHLCKVTTCINPDHLEPVTLHENIMRGTSPSAIHAKQTHCVNGHEFNEENTAWETRKGRKVRKCITCRRKHVNAWYAKKALVT